MIRPLSIGSDGYLCKRNTLSIATNGYICIKKFELIEQLDTGSNKYKEDTINIRFKEEDKEILLILNVFLQCQN